MTQIVLSNGMHAIIDDSDAELVQRHNWFLWRGRHTNYAATSVRGLGRRGGTNIKMHRLILGLEPNGRRHPVVDHVDGNGLNNCRSNLRVCSVSENLHAVMRGPRGKSRFRGVYLHKQTGKWAAKISVRGRAMHLGLFDSEDAAAIAYNQAAISEFGCAADVNIV